MAQIKGKQIKNDSLDLEKLRSGSKYLPDTATFGSEKANNEITDPRDFTTKDYVDTGISTEASTRGQVDTYLQNQITAEASTRGQVDTYLQNQITAEASTRGQVDTYLQNQINNLTSGTVTDGTNGITKSGTILKLGGALSENTTITGVTRDVTFNTQTFTSNVNDSIYLESADTAGNYTNNIVISNNGIEATYYNNLTNTYSTMEVNDNRAWMFWDNGVNDRAEVRTNSQGVMLSTNYDYWYAILRTTNLTTTDRTFEFPDASGTLALAADIQVYTEGNGIDITSNVVSLDVTSYSSASAISLTSTGSNASLVSSTGTTTLNGASVTLQSNVGDIISMGPSGMVVTDASGGSNGGLRYAADYSLNYNDRSLVDKAYVDSIASGLDPKESVRFATTANLAWTYNEDTSGTYVPAPGSQDSLVKGSAITSVDFDSAATSGFTLQVGDRILVRAQTDPKQNGIYQISNLSTGTIIRAADQDGSPTNEVSGGNYTFVENGTYANLGFVLQGDGVLTLNTNNLVWVQYSGAGQITATNGLTKVANTLKLGGTLIENTSINGAFDLAIGDTTKLSTFDLTTGVAADNSNLYMDNYEATIQHVETGGVVGLLSINTNETVLEWTETGMSSPSRLILTNGGVGIDTQNNSAAHAFLKTTNVTADRTFEFQNTSGTLALLSNITNATDYGSNGITKTGNTFKLGGTLIENTAINGAYNFELGTTTKLSYFEANAGINTDWSRVNMDQYEAEMVHSESGSGVYSFINLNSSDASIEWFETGMTSPSRISLTNGGIGLDTQNNSAAHAFLKTTNVTADRTFEFQNTSGTLALLADITNATDYGSNGITKTGNTFKLGGSLIENTTITGASYDLSISVDTIDLISTNSQLHLNNGGLYTDIAGTNGGLKYAADYSSSYTSRSLVDKAYVDAAVSGSALNEFRTVSATGGTSGTTGISAYSGAITFPANAVTDAEVFVNGIKLLVPTDAYFGSSGNAKPSIGHTLYFDITSIGYDIESTDVIQITYLT
jgi:hypothetical protein